jgi:hypothetical protein
MEVAGPVRPAAPDRIGHGILAGRDHELHIVLGEGTASGELRPSPSA